MEAKGVGEADSRDQMRAGLHAMWAGVAGAWGEHAEYADARGAQIAAEMLDRTAPRPGERVLELACGAGGVGMAAAERVGPEGEVVLSDVAAEMTAVAAARAGARGLTNVSTRELDLEEIDEPGESYDVVLCREGFMFAVDPARAASEIRHVLRPAGRVALAVWGPRERNPWLGVVLDVVSAQIGAPVPPPGIPGPFALSDADRVAGLLTDAGLEDVRVSEIDAPLEASSFDEWWGRTSALAGPLSRMIASLPDDGKQALRERARQAVKDYETPAGLEFPGVSLLATARRG